MVYCLTLINESLKATKNTLRFDKKFDPEIVEELAEVPPYPTPLNRTDNKNQWWTQHRPLLLQTAALGPIETINSGIELPRGESLADRGHFMDAEKSQ
jgi:hypothetical protein